MPNPLVVFRVGWMATYAGPDEIVGGGAFVDQHGAGGEMWNFAPDAGRCYGYVMTRNSAGVRIDRIAGGPKRHPGDHLDGVDVAFIAKNPDGGGQYIVGAYVDATVYERIYHQRPNPLNEPVAAFDANALPYLCEVAEASAILVPQEQRTFRVPYAVKAGYGPGHSNVWYGDNNDPRNNELKRKISEYVHDLRGKIRPDISSVHGLPAPTDLIREVEKRSMAIVESHFRLQGYKVIIVALDYCGWDLTARRGEEELRLEVKGHLGNVVQFELTPNEYNNLKSSFKTYRVCLVRNVLAASPMPEIYTPTKIDGTNLILRSAAGAEIRLEERVAAKAFQVR